MNSVLSIILLASCLVALHAFTSISTPTTPRSPHHVARKSALLNVRIPLFFPEEEDVPAPTTTAATTSNVPKYEMPNMIAKFEMPDFAKSFGVNSEDTPEIFQEEPKEEEPVTPPTRSTFQLPDISGWTSLSSDFSKNFDLSQVINNMLDKEQLGNRGEVYVAGQALLILSILLGGIPFIGDALTSILGPACLLGGFAFAALSVIDLGSDSLSPFPAATPTSTLKTSGIYKEMRHPMYSGLLLIMLGFTILTDSADRLLLTGGLYYLLQVKSDKEEEFLVNKFPNYTDYQAQVTEKFLPMSLMNELPWNK